MRRPATNSVSTLRPRWRGSLMPLYSLPSEKVPAPPSPNWTLLSGSRTPRRHRPQVSRVRSRTSLPRSRMIGRKPISARVSAASRPHGPVPMTTGRAGGALNAGQDRVAGVGRRPDAGVALVAPQHIRLIPDRDIGGVDQTDGGPAASVMAAAGDGQADQVGGRNAQPIQHRIAQRIRRMIERQLQFGQAQHGRRLFQCQAGRTRCPFA